jgi:hypothetical protein
MKFLVFLVSGEERNTLPGGCRASVQGAVARMQETAQEKQSNSIQWSFRTGGCEVGEEKLRRHYITDDKRETMRTSSLFLRTVLYSKWSRF